MVFDTILVDYCRLNDRIRKSFQLNCNHWTKTQTHRLDIKPQFQGNKLVIFLLLLTFLAPLFHKLVESHKFLKSTIVSGRDGEFVTEDAHKRRRVLEKSYCWSQRLTIISTNIQTISMFLRKSLRYLTRYYHVSYYSILNKSHIFICQYASAVFYLNGIFYCVDTKGTVYMGEGYIYSD